MRKKSQVEETINDFVKFSDDFAETEEIIKLADSENDEELMASSLESLQTIVKRAKELEISTLFSGKEDAFDCFFEIQAGAGGTESHDWAEMLMRMYVRWSERHKFKYEIVSILGGEEAGIKSVCIKISGRNAFGWLKNESGVHRLVRISPFNAQGKRQTSFASAYAYPAIEDDIDIEINEKDLRIDTYRSSGAGGQHVNTTDSAVRITHIPTNIVTQCQSDRSQHKNKAEAMKMLKARLYEHEMKKREKEIEDKNAQKTDIGWGHQIRSYVLHPYKMVKDHRTDYEKTDTEAVLDGELDGFMYEMLKKSAIER
jgi:peptide chain release factor 2